MPQLAYGEVKPASTTTALRATDNLTDKAAQRMVHAIQFQALANQTGGVLICSKETPTTTADVFHRIPPRTNGVDFAWSVGVPPVPGGLQAETYWILPEVADEGVRITAIEL